ncbi:hypothetical protein OJF2_00170 [Aquisphaera giovannonii]|uniref:Uncharacterized protein n=1 Tax=Aquisphaera giovannonii TaxID=406548 RepID=A0A5B9VTD0_9BACT|nr:hypothetical protein [Aquisphaera giovannonii]QEH31552.1 hypothetical protein OJF2_00170 [Aquisphaera giovannonii]
MGSFKVVGLVLMVLGSPLALYGLHRLALGLEDRGFLYYLRRKPRGGCGRSMLTLQAITDPRTEHVLNVAEDPHDEAGNPAGPGDPPRVRIRGAEPH